MTLDLTIDSPRLTGEIDTLAAFSETPLPAVTRILFTAPDLQARAYLTGLCEEAGLAVRTDPIGNIFARWTGSDAAAPAVGTGSHIDAIPESGRYDGTVGVLGALEAFRALKRAGFQPRRSLEILLFTAEEPTRFGLGCLGSRLLSGARTPSELAALHDADDISVEEARTEAGCTGSLADAVLGPDYYAAFVELHIEQGPLLEQSGTDIGVVTSIAAPAALRVTMTGDGGHAGAVLMAGRRDALLGASELALAVDHAARATGSEDTVATTGLFQVSPGAVNSIPSRVVLEIDVRDTVEARRDGVVEAITEAALEIAARRGLGLETRRLNADPPATAAPEIVSAVTAAADTLGLSALPMVSRAYHDSLFMARLAPTGMIFIPCRGGVSHRPDEYSSPAQIGRGVAVLALTLAALTTRNEPT